MKKPCSICGEFTGKRCAECGEYICADCSVRLAGSDMHPECRDFILDDAAMRAEERADSERDRAIPQ